MINVKDIAKRGNFAFNQKCSQCKYGRFVQGHKFCMVIGDVLTICSDYICPKRDDELKYCEKYDTYCHKINTCDKCPIE